MAPDGAFEAWLAERADFAATSLLGLTLRPTFDAGWDAAVAASPAPAAAPREDDDFRAGYAQAQSDAMCGCKCEGSKRVSLTVYRGNGPEQEVIDCRFCELIPPMFERGAAAREAARGEGED